MDGHRGEVYELQNHPGSTGSSSLNHGNGDSRTRAQSTLPPLTTTPERSTAFLDGVRGLAALFVFIQHYIGPFDFNVHEHGFGQDGNYYLISLPFIRLIFSGGSAAVPIFFVLSGYVLSKTPLRLFREGKRHACLSSLVTSVIRRPIRLYLPPLATTFIIANLLHVPGLMPFAQRKDNISVEIAHWLSESAAFFNPFRTHGHESWYSYNLVVWTIPIELKGSMLVYGMMVLYAWAFYTAPQSLSVHLLFLNMLGLLLLGEWTMACFLAGLILAFCDTFSLDTDLIAYRLTLRAERILWNSMFVVGLYLVSQPAHSGHLEYSWNTPGWNWLSRMIPNVYHLNQDDQYFRFWHSWGAFLLIWALLRLDWAQRFLSLRPLIYLGKISFMLYLIHLPLMAIFDDRIARLFGRIGPGAPDGFLNNTLYIPDIGPTGLNTRFLVCMAVMMAIVLVVSNLGTKYIDIPSVRLGKILVKKLEVERRMNVYKEDDVPEVIFTPRVE